MALSQTWVVIPAYNEGEAIGPVLEGVRSVFRHVVVVDDGSTDDTSEVSSEAEVTVLRHRVNLGQGAALQTGITYALHNGAQRIATFDADDQHRVSDVRRLVDRLEKGDVEVVLGSRFLEDTSSIPRARRVLLRAAILFTRATTGLTITDAHNGLRAFTAKAASAIQIRNNRMAHASELLDQVACLRLPYCEIPVRIRYTRYSLAKGQKATDGFRILLDYFLARVFR